jgi:hypothetical protein
MTTLDYINTIGIDGFLEYYPFRQKIQKQFSILNYKQREDSYVDDDIVFLKNRGMILKKTNNSPDEWTIVYRCLNLPILKYNANNVSKYAKKVIEQCDVIEKIDGIFVKLFFDTKWHIASKLYASLNESSPCVSAFLKAFKTVDNETFTNVNDLSDYLVKINLPTTISYMFEVVGPNIIVNTKYNDYKIFAIYANETESGRVVNNLKSMMETRGIYMEYPKVYFKANEFKYEDIIEMLDNNDKLVCGKITDKSKLLEGVVIYNNKDNIVCTIKSKLYISMNERKLKLARFYMYIALSIFKNEPNDNTERFKDVPEVVFNIKRLNGIFSKFNNIILTEYAYLSYKTQEEIGDAVTVPSIIYKQLKEIATKYNSQALTTLRFMEATEINRKAFFRYLKRFSVSDIETAIS